MTEMRIVVGSGPNAVAVTHALLERGFPVTILDIGETLDPATADIVRTMSRQEPDEWSQDHMRRIRRVDFAADPGLPPKRAFGSAFPYALDPALDAPRDMKLYGSHAFGGLSNVWGCALLPATPQDLAGWPPEIAAEIIAAYPKIRDLVQQVTGADILAPATHLRISAAAEAVMGRFRRLPPGDGALNLYPSPLAISKDCKACNGCMYGCVYGYTYNSRATVEQVFARNRQFRYRGATRVDGYAEAGDGVDIRVTDLTTGGTETIPAKQLFLAAGMMASLKLVWRSSPAVARTLSACDASVFAVPGIMPSLSGFRGGRHHGQSHLSADISGSPFHDKPVHIQLYFDNPVLTDGLEARLPMLGRGQMQRLRDFGARFLTAAQGYLHSDFCHRLTMACGDDGTVKVTVDENPATAAAIDAALSQLVRQMRRLGLLFIRRAAEVTPYGGSKTAGALGHAAATNPAASDPLGRPFGAQRVFVVDATVMSSIPGRNHTLTMMANALRIGQSA